MVDWQSLLPQGPLSVGSDLNQTVVSLAVDKVDEGEPCTVVGELLNDSMALDLFEVARGVFCLAKTQLDEKGFEELYGSSVDAYLTVVDDEDIRISSRNRGSGSNEVDLIIGGGFGTAAYKDSDDFNEYREIAVSRLSALSGQERPLFRPHSVAYFRGQRALYVDDVAISSIQDELVNRLYSSATPLLE